MSLADQYSSRFLHSIIQQSRSLKLGYQEKSYSLVVNRDVRKKIEEFFFGQNGKGFKATW